MWSSSMYGAAHLMSASTIAAEVSLLTPAILSLKKLCVTGSGASTCTSAFGNRGAIACAARRRPASG